MIYDMAAKRFFLILFCFWPASAIHAQDQLLYSNNLSGQRKPNIVLVLADDCTSWDLGVYGSKDSKTPAIDQLAKEGIRFTKCYQSTPVCSPTRQNLLTGLSPFQSGAYPNHTEVDSHVKSIAQYLTPLGYRVALGGKQHYGPSKNFPIEYLGQKPGQDPNFANVDTFLNSVYTKKQPFCLFICSHQPHSPWNKGDTSLFNKDKITLPPMYPDLPITRRNFRNYLAEINYLDSQVKTTLELINKYQLTENTVFIFASEQGNSFPFAKWTCYNAGLRSALIVRWPGKIKPNSVSNALVEYADLLPTFVDLAGGNPVPGLDGNSILPVLTKGQKEHRKYTFGQMTTRGIIDGSDYYPIRSVSNGKYRYIINLASDVPFRNAINKAAFFKEWIADTAKNPATKQLVDKYIHRPFEELYNDEDDPFNQLNLIDDNRLASVREELRKQLKKQMLAVGDQGILTELLAFEHMPGKRSGYPVIVDTIMHPAVQGTRTTDTSINFRVPVDGYYTFYVTGTGGLDIDDESIVRQKKSAVTGNEMSYGVIGLKRGCHTVSLKNIQMDQVSYSGPLTPLSDLNGYPIQKHASKDDLD